MHLQDLLQPKSMDLQLRESPEEGVYVAGLKEVLVTRLEDCLELLKLGERNRRVIMLLQDTFHSYHVEHLLLSLYVLHAVNQKAWLTPT